MLQKTISDNRQVQRTKEWITDALFLLLDEESYDRINISDITEKAGVARSSFYRNFESKDDIILQYLDGNLNACLLKIKSITGKNKIKTIFVTFPIKQLIEQREKIKKIFESGLGHLFLKHFQTWGDYVLSLYKGKTSKEEKMRIRYLVKFQLAGITNILFDWILNDMPIPAEKLGGLLHEFLLPFEKQIDNAITLLLIEGEE